MNILFDFDITNPGEYKFQPAGDVILQDMLTFVHERLKVLEDEINLYPNGLIILHVFGTLSDELGISYTDFPNSLSDKMETCVTNNDIAYLLAKWDKLFPKK